MKVLKEEFLRIFSRNDNLEFYFAPGRVNLIGEHTDYNGGNVFPCALNFGTYALARKTDKKSIKIYSKNFPQLGMITFENIKFEYVKKHDWGNYPKGIMSVFEENGYFMDGGIEILFYGDIPSGAGLSSSASIELVTAVLLNDIFDFKIDMIEMVKMCQIAENKFIGMNCGIMDQFVIGMGKKEHAILLDTNTLKYRYCKLELGDVALVIANTNKRRGLVDSKYNERRHECENALKQLQSQADIQSLGELTEKEFEKYKHCIKDEIQKKRAKHAVYENQRTLKAVKALENGELEVLGMLMNSSHISLRDDYEVTGKELDTLVELAWQEEGVIGSRMTGAGFGGCSISIIQKEKIQAFIENIGRKYKEKIGYEASFYVASTSHGARKLSDEEINI